MPFYKDNQKAILYKDNYEPANAYGPGGSYALKFINKVTYPFTEYSTAYTTVTMEPEGVYKVTRKAQVTSGYSYLIRNLAGTVSEDVIKAGHQYYMSFDYMQSKAFTGQCYAEGYWNNGNFYFPVVSAVNEWVHLAATYNSSTVDTSKRRNRCLFGKAMCDSYGGADGDWYKVKNIMFFDLTEMFGAGYEPTGTVEEKETAIFAALASRYKSASANNMNTYTYIPTKVPTAYWIGENCNVHWNMINGNNCSHRPHQGITYTNNQNGSWTINGTSTGYSFQNIKSDIGTWLRNNHKYLIYCKGLKDTYTADGGLSIRMLTSPDSTFGKIMINADYYLFTAPDDIESLGVSHIFRWCVGNSEYTYDNVTLWPQLFDLTEMFGAGYEPTIDEFKAMYPNDYYPYDESYSPCTSVGNRITAYKGNNYVNFRQLFDITKYGSNSTLNGITYTKGVDGSVTLNGTVTGDISYWLLQNISYSVIKAGHKYYFTSFLDGYRLYLRYWDVEGHTCETSNGAIWTAEYDQSNISIYLRVGPVGQVYDNVKIYPMLFDLTEMFGAGHEPTKEQFDLLFPNTYYPYTASTYIRDVKGYDTQLTIPGGPLYFNQIIPDTTFDTTVFGLHEVRTADGKITITGTATNNNCYKKLGEYPVIKGHKYLLKHGSPYVKQSTQDYVAVCLQKTQYMWSETLDSSAAKIATATETGTYSIYQYVMNANGLTINTTACPYIVDLTAMYGYGNEPTVDEFLAQYPNSYYPYTTSKLIPAQVRKDLYRVNFNQKARSSSSATQTKCGITVTKTLMDQYITFTATGTAEAWSGDPNFYIVGSTDVVENHKYYIRANGGDLVSMYATTIWTTHPVFYALGTIVTASATQSVNNYLTIRFSEKAPEGTVVNETFAIEIIDLTQTFGAGKEPDNVYILNELFGHTFLPYTTSMWVDSPNNIITETPSQITKMLAGYRTVQKQGYEISVDGTYNDPFVCTYYPEQSTQLTSTGANKVDLVNYAGEVGLEVLPDGRFKWTQSPTSSGRFLGFFTNPDGSYVSLAAGQTLRFSGIVDEAQFSGGITNTVRCIVYYSDDTVTYITALSSDSSYIGQWQTKSFKPAKDVAKLRLYLTNESGTQPTDYVIFKDFQLEIDTNVGQYEPYTSQLPAPTPTNMLPISYNKSQKIVLDTDATHSTYNFPITSDAKLIWKPSDYSTDFRVNVFNEGVRMKKRVGTDYAQIVPLVTKSSAATDTAFGITTNSVISLEANKTYCLVFRYKKVNSTCVGLQKGTSTEWACNIQHTDGTITECLEVPCLTHDPSAVINKDFCYDEGWSWARYTPPTTGDYKVRIGTDSPNLWKVIEDRGSYIQFTDIALYEGELTRSNQSITNLQAVLSDGNKQTIVSNKELPSINGTTYFSYLQPYTLYNNEYKCLKTSSCKVITVTGTESWTAHASKPHTFYARLDGCTVNNGWCTHFPKGAIGDSNSIYLSYSVNVYITYDDVDTVDEFKAWLASEYSKGTPLMIVTGDRSGSGGTPRITEYESNPLLAHTLPYHTDINTDAEYVTVSVKESI